MSYTPTTWNTGDTITASALNKMEQGIADGGGGGYDAEVYIYHDNNSAHNFEVTIVSGNFASLYAMVQDAKPPHILLRVWDDLNADFYTTTLIAVYTYTSSQIYFKPKRPTSITGSSNVNAIVRGDDLVWYSDDTITYQWY